MQRGRRRRRFSKEFPVRKRKIRYTPPPFGGVCTGHAVRQFVQRFSCIRLRFRVEKHTQIVVRHRRFHSPGTTQPQKAFAK